MRRQGIRDGGRRRTYYKQSPSVQALSLMPAGILTAKPWTAASRGTGKSRQDGGPQTRSFNVCIRNHHDRQRPQCPLRQRSDQEYLRPGTCRRTRQPAEESDRLARQAGSSIWRKVPHRRFSLVKLRQLRNPPHRRGDAIQVAQPDPAHPARLEFSRRPFSGVRRYPARLAANRGRELVSRNSRRGVPESRHPALLRTGLHPDTCRRSYLQDGLRKSARLPRRQKCRHDGGLPGSSRGRKPRRSASWG